MKAQTIQIDSTFNSNGEIYPFENIETISSLTIEGDIILNHDTSLVRVILEDESGFEYMVLEAYPLICEDLDFSVKDYCDETCALEQCKPISIIIQIIDAEITIDLFSYETDPKGNPAESRYQAKRAKDEEKIGVMNERIPEFQMNWTSGDNSIVASYYDQKRNMFGDGYNLLGYDYYTGGVFEFLGHRDYPQVDPDLVRHFDWRERHGANDSLSPYYDGDTLGTGWLTSVKSQNGLATCWAFSAAGLTEAISNLYANDHLDYDLSEMELISCFDGDCNGGDNVDALTYITSPGLVEESCFPYDKLDCTLDSCNNKCTQPTVIISITDTFMVNDDNYDSIRYALIKHGPLSTGYMHTGNLQPGAHAVILCGFWFDASDSSLIWIIKNSWGVEDDWGINGFCNLKVSNLIDGKTAGIILPVKLNGNALETNCYDNDSDGYYFWGIGERPVNCGYSQIEDCDDNDPFVGGYDENYNCRCILEYDSVSHQITSDTTWNDTTYVSNDVRIDSGACLTIRGYTAFAPDVMVIVNPGGKLILDSAYLTKACPELWDGIEVRGSNNCQFYDQYFGVVEIRDSSIIEFARCAIANHCKRCSPAVNQSGGIIAAEDAIFRNNETDILLLSFHNMYQGHEVPYEASFEKCRFLTTEDFYSGFVPKSHVEMKDVFGLIFYGCIFENQADTSAFPYEIRGNGITSVDAQYMIKAYCNNQNTIPCEDIIPCQFNYLEYGIKSMNALSKKTVNIDHCDFDRNMIGVSFSGVDYASVLSSEFTCPKLIKGLADDRFSGGLFMEGCTGYHIEDNYFHGNLYVNPSHCNGIGVKNSGDENNEIYNNEFAKLKIGIYSIGENRGHSTGLCLKCNDMSGNTNDFIVVEDENPPLGASQGIYQYQGDPIDSVSYDAPAGNTFSYFPGSADTINIEDYNYFNESEYIRYYHHKSNEFFQVLPLPNNYTSESIQLIERKKINYAIDSVCLSHIGGENNLKTFTSPHIIIAEADDQIALLMEQLISLIDGGNTEDLNFEVMTSLPDDALEIRQELLDESPYLSDTVMKQAIYKENVLPNAMIRDILTVNPQSAKSNGVMNALDTRYEAMPDYMMAQILEGQRILGAKELLEAQIQSWQIVRSKAKAELFRQYLNDTNLVSQADSIIAFLEEETDLKSKYDLVFTYWNKGGTDAAFETLNAIPGQFYLTNDQLAIHQQYQDYLNILEQMADSNWNAGDLDSASVQLLFEIKDNGASEISARARGMLVKGGVIDYKETIVLPQLVSPEENSFANKNINDNEQHKDYLKLFPNPAGDYVIVYYDIASDSQQTILKLTDYQGIVTRTFLLEAGKNQVVVNLENLPNGIYLFNLYINGKKLESHKLIKVRQ